MRLDQRGVVALFTTIIISLLLVVITVSLITIETLQLRKAEDSEQSLRAYYTAEAGAEAAVAKILSKDPSLWSGTNWSDQNCSSANSSFTGYDGPGQAGWTCQQVSFSGSPEGKLNQPDQAVTVDPGHVTPGYNSVLLEWNQSSNASGYDMGANMFSGNIPNAAQYAAGGYSAPPVELSIVEYPNGGFSANDVCSYEGGAWVPNTCKVKLQNVVFAPNGIGPVGGSVDPYNAGNFNSTGPVRSDCGPIGRALPASVGGGNVGYNCWAAITNLNANDYIFRLRSRYATSTYKMIFCHNSNASDCNNPIAVPDGTATIDVTARAGQSYRRVIYKLPIAQGASGGLNYVMYSDTDICKNFSVINDVAQPPYPCP
jgi:hypothetical protein